MDRPKWQWNEMQQVGTDYADMREVEIYETRMSTLRDIDNENENILRTLALPTGSEILEIGCGTGRFSRKAAASGYRVAAADVSQIMIDYVAMKAIQENAGEIELRHAGFLMMDFPENHFNAVVTVAALHHLPDVWKQIAFDNIFRCLKPGGQLLLRDVIFSFGESNYMDYFNKFIRDMPDALKQGATGHVAREYSTFDWIIEGLLQRAGFEIINKTQEMDSFFIYHCRKA
jgi:ubiquinone/menaquinone biosynthesis C-methylase UbiE